MQKVTAEPGCNPQECPLVSDWIGVALAGVVTMLATGLGVIPVYLLGGRTRYWRPFLVGLAAGAMAVAAVIGLILPGLDLGSGREVAGGLVVGVAVFALLRWVLRSHEHDAGAVRGADLRRAALIFSVLFVHSLPEGFAVGTAYAAPEVEISIFVIVAIALQNIPEGTSIAIPLRDAEVGFWKQFWIATGTSLPQPIGALIAYALVDLISGLLPVSFGFAAGAMLLIVVLELIPDGFRRGTMQRAGAGAVVGAAMLFALELALG